MPLIQFGLKDVLDILLVGLLLYYVYKIMKESGSLNIFFGLLAFIIIWIVTSEILDMRLIGTIMDKFMSIGLIICVILFQEPLKRFLFTLGSHRRWRFLNGLFSKNARQADSRASIMPIVYACMSMSKSKTGALIVVEGNSSLLSYERLGDVISADINSRLIENIFFKNSPLHDGAMIISHNKIMAAGCVLPVSHDDSIPRHLGLRHRAALGIAQATDALAVVVSEESGNISIAQGGRLDVDVNITDLEHRLTEMHNK